MSDFHTLAYELQADHHEIDRAKAGDGAAKLLNSWFDDTTADYWRQSRMYDFAKLFADGGGTTWLTVGDGRYGIDSIELKKRGIRNILPSDISEYPLKQAKEKGFIDAYAVENAEKLSFQNGAFDYVVCKESFHHFPRPFIALYEMLRVAKQGVIVIEPNDFLVSPLGLLVFKLKQLFGKAKHTDDGRYEESGNYVYSVSEREMEKACLGLDLPVVFFKGLNDAAIAGAEFVPAKFSSPIFVRMRAQIMLLDLLCALRLFRPTRLLTCIFKREPSADLRKRLVEDGWRAIDLPRNPYRAS